MRGLSNEIIAHERRTRHKDRYDGLLIGEERERALALAALRANVKKKKEGQK